jgi:hypothetical protein
MIFYESQYVAEMIGLFGRASLNLCDKLDAAASNGANVEMESLFSRLTLDIIGKAVFNYDFDSLSNDTGIVEVRSYFLASEFFISTIFLQHTYLIIVYRQFMWFCVKQRTEVYQFYHIGKFLFSKTFIQGSRK